MFSRPADFDLAEHLEKSFGVFHGGDGQVEVRVRFSPAVARYVRESQWHASQQLTNQPDRGLLATFQLSGTQEIKSWIMSFGRHAEVPAPPELREEVASELAALLETYGRTSAEPPPNPNPKRKRGENRVHRTGPAASTPR